MTRDTFSYKHIKTVYTIVLFERSGREFQNFPNHYIHTFHQTSDTGIELELLQKFVFVPFDIFQKTHHNKPIETRLEAWLTFLSSDKPEDVIALIEKYPDFRLMYAQVYEICQNVEKVMGMFSKELYEMDRNTVRYMMDEMQSEIDQQKAENARQEEKIARQKRALEQQRQENMRQKKELEERELALQEALKQIEQLKKGR